MTPTEDRAGAEATAREIATKIAWSYSGYLNGRLCEKLTGEIAAAIRAAPPSERDRVKVALTRARETTNSLYSDLTDLLTRWGHPCVDPCQHAHCPLLRALDQILEERRTEIFNARRADDAAPPSGLTPPRPTRAELNAVVDAIQGGATAPDPVEVMEALWRDATGCEDHEEARTMFTSFVNASIASLGPPSGRDWRESLRRLAEASPLHEAINTLADLLVCFRAHEGAVRIVGNVRADEAAKAVAHALTVLLPLSIAPASARSAAPEDPRERAAPPREASGGASRAMVDALREVFDAAAWLSEYVYINEDGEVIVADQEQAGDCLQVLALKIASVPLEARARTQFFPTSPVAGAPQHEN